MRIPRSIYNWLSIAGLILSGNALILIISLFIVSISMDTGHTYLGLYIYIVLPIMLVIGLLLIPLGMIIQIRKRKKLNLTSEAGWPVLDLNNRGQRVHLIIASVSTLLFVLISAAGSYKAYHYTESTNFCGKLCHSVMNPEYTTYLNSPHARVKCVECHVGEGADWYVKSKLSGLYQVYSVIFKKYHRPIETPIDNLRPARETCENCHWPQKFYSKKLRIQRGFLSDSTNTAWNISLLMKIGPDHSAFGLKEGIHWHINPDVRIEYKASQKDREKIPWVKYTNKRTGEVHIYQDEENTLSKSKLDSLPTRIFDCMDCHNRPSHQFNPTNVFVDNGLLTGSIPKDLRYIKKATLRALKDPFSSSDSAKIMIKKGIYDYYTEKHPEILTANHKLVDKAIVGVENEFFKNNFPEMNITGTSYLNHIGHMYSDGCFRCHSDKLKNETGKVISKDCNLCHTIVAQGPTGKVATVPVTETMEFQHPIDIGTDWKDYNCTECHRNP